MNKYRIGGLFLLLILLINPQDTWAVDTQAEMSLSIDEQALRFTEINDLQFDAGDGEAFEDFELIIKDARGSGNGWSLRVSVSDFIEEKSKLSLKGIAVTLGKGEVQTNNQDQHGFAPSPQQITINAGSENPPVEILKAGVQKGAGTWSYRIDKENCNIEIPADTPPGKYIATMRWEIIDAPL